MARRSGDYSRSRQAPGPTFDLARGSLSTRELNRAAWPTTAIATGISRYAHASRSFPMAAQAVYPAASDPVSGLNR